MNDQTNILSTPLEAPRVYSYTRFSTPEQAAGDSKRRQAEGAQRWMDRKNADRLRDGLPALVFDDRLSLSDLGVSAYRGANTGQDAGLGGFLHACREGFVPCGSYLVVESLDRISRQTPRKVSRLLDDIVEAGVVISTLSDGQEYDEQRLDSDPTALLIALMVSWRAHEESKVKGQRLSAAWEEKRKRVRSGKDGKLTAKGPAWLKWEGEEWVERKPHADTVRRIYKMALEGTGEHKTAEILNSEGVPVMGRGKMWHRSTVSKVLRSAAVIGTLTPGKVDYSSGKKRRLLEEPILDAFPSVVSEADWLAVRALKDGKAPAVRGRGASTKLANLFAGLATCSDCGARMTRVMKGSGKKGGQPKLVCTAAKAGAAPHGYLSVPLEAVETAFLGSWQSLLAEIPVGEAGGALDAECENLAAVIAVTVDQLEEASARLEREPSSAFASQVRGLTAALASYRSDLEQIEQQRAMADHGLAVARAGSLADVLLDEEGSPVPEPERGRVNAVLRSVFEGVVIDHHAGVMRFRWRQGGEATVRYSWPQ
jgi:DNA invertase Pin-like site-specific DNA recombinase